MERLRVNPTRMELTRLKKRIKTARRGHKLLKDKRDELMKQFIELIKKNKSLRDDVEKMLEEARIGFANASALTSSEVTEEALMYPKKAPRIKVTYENRMSVEVPVFEIVEENIDRGTIFPYGFAFTACELDGAIKKYTIVSDKLLILAQIEKTIALMSDEIEKTRRRVNALEYILIPRLSETIKYITMKLEENERGNISRLMKVKDMIIEEKLKKDNKKLY
jgi:V/A-type H+/Na+-transporting ATPase subunit D